MEGYSAMKPPNVRVTVLEDPNNSLQELFNPVSQRQSVPWRERHLPKSFFVPPTEGPDSSKVNRISNSRMAGFVISHNKANSSPASLDPGIEPSFSINNAANIHAHQKSLDVGTKYPYSFCPDPAFDTVYDNGFLQSTRIPQASYICRTTLPDAICELPPGYDLALNAENKVYFLNHQTEETTWFDPRIPEEFQDWGMTLEQLREVHINYAKQFLCGSSNNGVGINVPPQLDRISPGLLPPSGVCTNPNSPGYRGQQLPNSSPPVNATASSTSPATCGGGIVEAISSVVPPVSPGLGMNPGTPVPTTSTRRHMNNGKLSTVAQLPPTHHPATDSQQHQQLHQQHQRQHSHGHPEPPVPVAQALNSHLRSCSQPVPMSTGCSAVGTNANFLPHNPIVANQSRSSSSANTTVSHLGSLSGSSIVGGGTRSSLIGLSMTSTPVGHILPSGHLSQHPQQPQSAGIPTTSSGQLVQGLEELRLNNPASTLILEHQQQEQQSQHSGKHHKAARSQYLLSPVTPTGGTTVSRFVTPGPLPITANSVVAGVSQHSHQGSMDSGVGQSTASTNQTPEHGVMVFYDPSLGDCSTEHMEGIAYTSDDLNCAQFSVFDNIDISDIGG